MNFYSVPLEVRWADIDPNLHLRHSVYYDYGAYCRMQWMTQNGLTLEYLAEHHLGPVILKEECIFRREIHFGDRLSIDIRMIGARQDFSRWTIAHHLYKNDHTLAAILTLDGAWIDTIKRKLSTPSPLAMDVFGKIQRESSFTWLNS